MAGLYSKEVSRDCPLWRWDGNDLHVWDYPVGQEQAAQRKRKQASDAARKRWAAASADADADAVACTDADAKRKEKKRNNTKTRVRACEGEPKNDEMLEAIYAAYPRHVGKKKALEAIGRSLKKIDGEKLLEIVETYAASQDGRADRSKIPHPTTWFNQERWEDDQSEWDDWKLDGQRGSTVDDGWLGG